LGQVEKQPHHQRRTETFFRRIDAALDKERRAHTERNVGRRNEPQVEPVRALAGNALAERAPDGVSWNEHPL